MSCNNIHTKHILKQDICVVTKANKSITELYLIRLYYFIY